jgi:hypothetical protein
MSIIRQPSHNEKDIYIPILAVYLHRRIQSAKNYTGWIPERYANGIPYRTCRMALAESASQ